jgi:hypothetical protein
MLPLLILLLPVGTDTMNITPNPEYWLFSFDRESKVETLLESLEWKPESRFQDNEVSYFSSHGSRARLS